jgi:RNA polymerase sigma factor (sigma-70 family)
MAEHKDDAVALSSAAGISAMPLEHLYERHADWLRGLLKRRLRLQNGDVDDLVQDTYLRAAKAPTSTLSHPKAFLAQVALNLFRDGKRREAVRAGHRNAVRLAAPEATLASAMTDQEAAFELRRLVIEMPQPCRDVFVLSRFRQMTNRDIAAHLGLSIKTVEWRISKALDYCMSRLQD